MKRIVSRTAHQLDYVELQTRSGDTPEAPAFLDHKNLGGDYKVLRRTATDLWSGRRAAEARTHGAGTLVRFDSENLDF